MLMSDSENLVLIDWDKSVALADHDPELARDILILTERSLPNDIKEITAAYKENDEREMRRLLHKLEGGISYAKFPKLEKATLAFHKAIHEDETEQFEMLHQELQAAIQQTLTAIQEKIRDKQ